MEHLGRRERCLAHARRHLDISGGQVILYAQWSHAVWRFGYDADTELFGETLTLVTDRGECQLAEGVPAGGTASIVVGNDI